MKGRDVDVMTPVVGYVDGDPVTEWRRERVYDVLIAPADTSDAGGADRPNGDRVALSMAFPKTFEKSLRGCRVDVDGEQFAVQGDPRPVESNCPTRWNRNVKAVKCDG